MRRFVICGAMLVVGWYAAVLLFFPSLSNGTPAIVDLVAANMSRYDARVCSGQEQFGDLTSESFGWTALGTPDWNRYYPLVLRLESGEAEAVVAYPRNHQVYKHGLLYRVALLDFSTYRFPTYVVMQDGTFCTSTSTGSSETLVPSASILGRIEDSDRSFHCSRRKHGLPCASDSSPSP